MKKAENNYILSEEVWHMACSLWPFVSGKRFEPIDVKCETDHLHASLINRDQLLLLQSWI